MTEIAGRTDHVGVVQAAGLDVLDNDKAKDTTLPSYIRLRALFALLGMTGDTRVNEGKEAALMAEEIMWCRTECDLSLIHI